MQSKMVEYSGTYHDITRIKISSLDKFEFQSKVIYTILSFVVRYTISFSMNN